MSDDRLASALAYSEHGLRRFGYVNHDDLHIRVVREAIATRRIHRPDRTFTGAVYDGRGRLIASTQRHNEHDIVPADDAEITAEDRELATRHRLGVALYGGILFPILGHFLFEAIARLWPLLALRPRHRVAVCFHAWPGLELEAFFGNPLYAAVLGAFGLSRENVVMIDQNCLIETLILPDPASRYHVDLNTCMAEVADRVSAHVGGNAGREPEAPTTIYLSRVRWRENRRISNEAEVELLVRQRGLRVVHPETLAPPELMRLLGAAGTVVASDGSHAHLAVFCRPGTRVVMLDTRPVPTQFAIARLRGFRTLHVPLFESPCWRPEAREVVPDRLAPLLDAALAHVGVGSPEPIARAVVRVAADAPCSNQNPDRQHAPRKS